MVNEEAKLTAFCTFCNAVNVCVNLFNAVSCISAAALAASKAFFKAYSALPVLINSFRKTSKSFVLKLNYLANFSSKPRIRSKLSSVAY